MIIILIFSQINNLQLKSVESKLLTAFDNKPIVIDKLKVGLYGSARKAFEVS